LKFCCWMERVIFSKFDRHSSGFLLKLKSLKFFEKKSKNSKITEKPSIKYQSRNPTPQINKLI
jgi:hypothetical protein